MVNKLWNRERMQRWFRPKSVPPPHPRCFTEPKCQDSLSLWYLVYRWLIFAAWLSIVIYSFVGVGTYNGDIAYGYQTWPIYLTNWDLMLGLIQSLLGVVLVTRRWHYQRKFDFGPEQLTFGLLERAYWYLYGAISSVAIGVTVIYWSLLYSPSLGVSALDILAHAFNSILMMIDFVVAGVPFELRHCWWPVSIAVIYLTFSIIYHLAGGTGPGGASYIYPILDWDKPGSAILVCVFGIVLVTLTHCLLHFLSKFKAFAYGKTRGSVSFSPRHAESTV